MIKLGRQTFVPEDFRAYEGLDITIGAFTSIASGVKIVSGAHPPIEHREAVSNFAFKEVWDLDYWPCRMGGQVKIGNDVWIGEGATILEGAVIDDGVIIGAGAVVSGYISPYAVVIGNPGKIIRYRFTTNQIDKLLMIGWWDLSEERIREIVPLMKNIDEFLEKYGTKQFRKNTS